MSVKIRTFQAFIQNRGPIQLDVGWQVLDLVRILRASGGKNSSSTIFVYVGGDFLVDPFHGSMNLNQHFFFFLLQNGRDT